MPDTVIVRLPNWLGDTVMAVPAIRALGTHWPETKVVLAGPWASLLAGQGLAEVLVDVPRRWTGRLVTADVMRRAGPDLALLLPNSFEAALSARYWGARRIVGFATGGRSWLLSDAVPLPAPRLHQVDEYVRLVEHLGINVLDRVPRIAPPAPGTELRERARALVSEAGGPDRSTGRPLIGIHLGAAHGPAKVWPADRVAELCRHVAHDGATAVLVGSAAEIPVARQVLSQVRALDLVGRDSRALLPSMLAELDVLVSGDTGVAHLAVALGTPAVTLFGPTDPSLTAPRGHAAVLHHAVPCAPCFYRTCPIDHVCLRGIGAAEVRDRVLALAVAVG